MRANDYLKTIEPNCGFYDILKKLIYEFAYYRNDKEGTESVYNFYLLQDKTRKKYLDELKMWELLEQDESHKPTYYENTFGITHDIASHIRDLLFSAIENDKSFGYLFYLLASEKNRTEIFYQNNPIDCIPDKKLIEGSIYNYQDDYPKKSLDEYLTYCDFNYSFYRKYKKKDHTNDFWFSVFFISYNLFDEARTLLFTPFTAIEIIKELVVDDENEKIFIITLVSQLIEQYNFDLTDEQMRGKEILVDEIKDYLNSLIEGDIPADPEIRSVGWLSKHPDLMTTEEQQGILNSFKILRDIGTEIQSIFPPFEFVKSKIDETPEIEDKIILLEDVIATWEVNASIAVIQRNDDTAEAIADKEISSFKAMLNYWKKMQELENKKALPKLEIPKKRSFLDDRKEINDQFNRPDVIAAMEENSRNQYRKLTEKDIVIVTNDCKAIEAVFVRGMEIFETFFDNNNLSENELIFLKESPFDGILSDNLFNITVLDHFNDSFIGVILENSFGNTIEKLRKSKLFIEFTDSDKADKQYQDLYRTILKINFQPILIKKQISDYIFEIEFLIQIVYENCKGTRYVEDNERNYFEEKNKKRALNFTPINQHNEIKTDAQIAKSDSETLIQTKSQLLKTKLSEYGFFGLYKIKILTPDKQSILVDKLVVKGIPYTIAMFDYIDFFKLLDNQYFETINKRNIQIADWLNTDVRSIRGNKNVLDKGTTENKKRYTAHLHKEKVIKDYELLK